jgi:hypothetical protein
MRPGIAAPLPRELADEETVLPAPFFLTSLHPLRSSIDESSAINLRQPYVKEKVEVDAAMKDFIEERPDMDENAAAAYVHSSPSTLKTWRSRGKGPAYYRGLGKEIRYRRSDLDAFIESRRIDPCLRPVGGVLHAA